MSESDATSNVSNQPSVNQSINQSQSKPADPFAFLQPNQSTTSPISQSINPSTNAHWYTPIVDTLKQNPVFSGGAGLALIGVSATIGRELLRQSIKLTNKHLIVSLEIPSKDRSYQWVLQWLVKQQQAQLQQSINQSNTKSAINQAESLSNNKPTKPVIIRALESLTRPQHMGVETLYSQSASGVVTSRFDLIPSPGEHSLWWKGHLIHYTRTREKSMVDFQTGSPWETLTLRLFGREKQRRLLLELLEEAKQAALQKTEGKTIIYTSSGIDWRAFGPPRTRRPINSVILDQGIAQRLHDDFSEFLKSQPWYLERGIPYRRGYLLYGPPGNGKSSFIQALAGELQYNICVLNLTDRSLTDDKLAYLMATLPPRSMLLLEDVDAAFTHTRENKSAVSLTFSGLLNALDGVASTEERVIFMTTNHHERLDPALIRPGRCDVQQYIGDSTAHQQKAMFKRFYPNADDQTVNEFLTNMQGQSVSVAELQGFFLLYKGDPVSAAMMSSHWAQLKATVLNKQPQNQAIKNQPFNLSADPPIHPDLAAQVEAHKPKSDTFVMSKDTDTATK